MTDRAVLPLTQAAVVRLAGARLDVPGRRPGPVLIASAFAVSADAAARLVWAGPGQSYYLPNCMVFMG